MPRFDYVIELLITQAAWSESIDWRAASGSLLLLVSTLIVHQSIPHYPLVVDLVVKDDIITKQNAPTQLSEAGPRQSILGGFAPCFRHNVGQCATLQVFHDNPQLLLHQGWFKHLHHIPVLIVPHDDHLQHKTSTWEPWEKICRDVTDNVATV